MLVEPAIADAIIRVSDLHPSDVVLEIGTGTGILTERLASRVKVVKSFEVDPKLFERVHISLSTYPNVQLVLGDAFSEKNHTLFHVCVTNLPYSRSLDFVKWLARQPPFRLAVVMVQEEFAQKLLAQPANGGYRAVSVIAQLSFRMELLMNVPPENFFPRPHVTSSVLKLVPKSASPSSIDDTGMKILNFLFSFRGRKLRSALRKLKIQKIPPDITDLLGKRVETLHPVEFRHILEVIQGQRP